MGSPINVPSRKALRSWAVYFLVEDIVDNTKDCTVEVQIFGLFFGIILDLLRVSSDRIYIWA